MDLSVIRIEEFLRSDMRTAKIDIELAYRLLNKVVAESQNRGIYRVLIDARGNPTGLSIADAYEIVADFERWGVTKQHRVAILRVRPEAFERAKYLETLAGHRGFNVRAFKEFEEALEFLNAE